VAVADFTIAKSSLLSLLKSATATEIGPAPVSDPAGVSTNVPSPLPSKTDAILSTLLMTIKSSRPSALKSPDETAAGPVPTATGEPVAGVKVPSPTPRRIVTVLSALLAIAKSCLPSLLKSPTVAAPGKAPLGGVDLTAKVPSPFPRRMLTVLLPLFTTARSSFPSLLKSPVTTAAGFEVVRMSDSFSTTEVSGVATGKKTAFDTPPPGVAFTTVTKPVFGLLTLDTGTVAVRVDLLTKVVLRGLAFQFTVAPETKLEPFTVRVNEELPGTILPGIKGRLINGTGLARPAPVTAAILGLVTSELNISREPLLVMGTVGENVTLILQLAPAARLLPQLLVCV